MQNGKAEGPRRVALVSTATALAETGFAGLAESGLEISPVARATSEAEQIASLAGYFGVVAGAEPYSRTVLEALPDLRIIARSGVGYDAIDVDAANDLGIHITITPGVNAFGVAEHALSMLLALMHRTHAYDERVRSGAWRDGQFFDELYGSTVGIVGFGRIGRSLARMLQPFDVTALAYDPGVPSDQAEFGVVIVPELEDMLPRSQVLSLHVPLVDSTRHLIGARQLALLPDGAVLVNTSRGPVVDQAALVDALNSGQLGGAALDVMDVEPPPSESPLLQAANCILAPHISSFGKRTVLLMSQRIVEQLSAAALGEVPRDLVSTVIPIRSRLAAT